jgi:predicted RNA-binding Zn ribbon-like protein
VIAFREALRRLLLTHNGGELDPAAVDTLDAVARDARVEVGFGADGVPHLEPCGHGANAALGRLLAVIARAETDGTWARLKTCPADDCMWAFYDFSRNRSRTWCTMAVCGNRVKARAYRRRARSS